MAKTSLTKNLTIRISELDDQALTRFAEKIGETNRTRIVRKLICEASGLGPYLLDNDLDCLREAAREVRSVGINFNQLVRAINSGKVALLSQEDLRLIQSVLKPIEALKQDLNDIILRSRNRWIKDGS